MTLPALTSLGVFTAVLAWYPVKDQRFLTPFTPIVMVLAAAGLCLVLTRLARLGGGGAWMRLVPAALALTAAVLLGRRVYGALTYPSTFRDPTAAYSAPPRYFDLYAWIRRHVPDGANWAMGPSHLYEYYWAHPLPGNRLSVPWVHDMDSLRRWLRKANVRFLVLDISTLDQRARQFSGYFERQGNGIRAIRMPDGWRIVEAPAGGSPPYVVFEIMDEAPRGS